MFPCTRPITSKFQSTLPRGERPWFWFCSPLPRWHFNPRSREGSDESSAYVSAQSLHFNPRSREGSDQFACEMTVCMGNFNPRSREGSDVAPPATDCNTDPFQSTLPRGERHIELQCNTALWKFQSTLPRGERLRVFHHDEHQIVISIHAPARGATCEQCGQKVSFKISIHAPARGATYDGIKIAPMYVISIHAPARGATVFHTEF